MQAAERWRELREQEKARERAAEQTPKASPAAAKEPPLSLEEQRRQAAERWLEYRRQALEHPDRDRDPARDRGLDQELDPPGQDGPEIE
jgi:hypothetical protein